MKAAKQHVRLSQKIVVFVVNSLKKGHRNYICKVT